MKLISIITINYNDGIGLKRTIESVLPILEKDIEYLVIDGGSKDISERVLSDNAQYIDKLVSEPDSGIANAFNKGIKLASGQYLMFINAGDTISDGGIAKIRDSLRTDEKESLVHIGRIRLPYSRKEVIAGIEISKCRQMLRNYLPHQGMVIKATCFERFGLYDETFHLGMDYEWSLRLLDDWNKISFHKEVYAVMDTGGISMSNFTGTFMAYHKARVKNLSLPHSISYIISVFFILKRSVGLKVKQLLDIYKV